VLPYPCEVAADEGRTGAEVDEALAQARRALDSARMALRAAERAAGLVGVDDAKPVESLTAQRINIVEPDGTLRLVVTNAAQFPGMIVRGHEHPHPHGRTVAGLVFFNDEATETGGLIFAGASSEDSTSSGVHLSFDNYEQDQVVVLSSSDDGPKQRMAQLEFVDRPDWSFVDLAQVDTTDRGAVEAFLTSRPKGVKRMRLAREPDGSVGLTLRDAEGQPRIVLQVPAEGDPSIELFDPAGNTVSRMSGDSS